MYSVSLAPLLEKFEKNVVLHCSGMRALEGNYAKSKSKKKIVRDVKKSI